ncbi:MAG TPA: thiamine diphosphokinase [Anaerolineae bacterium]|nr:thiamine diphosphokinase [Anaerolineae bacterium]
MDEKSLCVIIANGDVENYQWLIQVTQQAALIIAVDGGCEHLRHADVIPTLVIGDLDSISKQTVIWIQQHQIETVRYPVDKDWTDLELAIQYAVEHFTGNIQIIGALGGRTDHAMANILLLAQPAWLNREIELIRPNERIWLFTGQEKISATIGDTISLIPIAGDVVVRATAGLKWPLKHSTLHFGFARGVSNILTATTATIQLESGILACFITAASLT